MKIISFALWGSNVGFLRGAVANLKLAEVHYPGWKCRIYCGADVPHRWLNELQEAGFQVVLRTATKGPCEGLFWRFEPAFDPKVSMFISRDLDSRVNPREAAAVYEWIASGKLLHTMRDNYVHNVPILGGMWGCRNWPAFGLHMRQWQQRGKMGDDQHFLQQIIWPLVRDNAVAHDLYPVNTVVKTADGQTYNYNPVEFYGQHDLRPFPAHAPMEPQHGSFVGSQDFR